MRQESDDNECELVRAGCARCEKVDDLLVEGAKGFSYTSNQDRYDECEMAISRHSILAKGKYYIAIGLVTEAVLSRLLQDILMLSDIPERVSSARIAVICGCIRTVMAQVQIPLGTLGTFSIDSAVMIVPIPEHRTPQWQIYLIYSKKVPWWTSKLMINYQKDILYNRHGCSHYCTPNWY
ncbi:ribosome biogenesis protein ytm1 [Leucoagaricus gongylophorus]